MGQVMTECTKSHRMLLWYKGSQAAFRRLVASLIPADLRLFTRALCSGPQAVGAACPSSRHLADYMAAQAVTSGNGYIVELGAGTGVVTAALLAHGLAPERLIVVEKSALLAEHLRVRFPHVTVLEGDAAQLVTLLGWRAKRVSTVVSSLPLKSLPKMTVDRIGSELDTILPKGATFIQFTYSLRCQAIDWAQDLTCLHSRTIWRNVPPARVNVFAWGES
ncbi:MAG: class I SAM-dependent methyltransferase [Acidiferrobacter sp.]